MAAIRAEDDVPNLRFMLALGILACGGIAIAQAYSEGLRPALPYAAGALGYCVASFIAWRWPAGARWLGHLNLAGGVVAIVLVARRTGHIHSAAIWFTAAIPLSAGHFLGVRASALWTAFSVGAVVLVTAQTPVLERPPEDRVIVAAHVALLLVLVFGFIAYAIQARMRQVHEALDREKTIRALADGLEKRTEELTDARDAALAASRAKSDFLATISHEIRTPLNGVLGMAGLLLDEPLDPKHKELVRTIRTSGDSLRTLLNDLLDFSKIEAGKIQLEHAAFDLRDAVEDVIDLFAAKASEKGLTLAAIVAPSVPAELVGDGGRVRQILVNLVSNAIKFTEQGEVVVTIEAEPTGETRERPVQRVRCAVRDTGIGISAARIGSLFEPFVQGDASTTRRFGGTGLGLAICKRIARAMNGDTWVESEEKKGSTFRFTFEAEEDRPSRDSNRAFGGKIAMLVVECGPIGAMWKSQLERLGFEVTHVRAAKEALEKLGSPAQIDVAFVDAAILTPDLDAALSDEEAPPVCVIALPGRPMPAELERGAPHRAILPRHARRAEIRRATRMAMAGERAEETSSAPPERTLAESPLRVLIAEDNPVNQRVAVMMLERLGHRADVVANGSEACDAARAHPYDLVLMDLQMPEMDGITATRVIRNELPSSAQPIIVAMTANARASDRDACADAGMDDFISKPVELRDLARAIGPAKKRLDARASDLLAPEQFDTLRQLVAASPGGLLMLVEEFGIAAERLIGDLLDAATANDRERCHRSAHSLKGAAAQMGARAVATCSFDIEKASTSEVPKDIRRLIDRLSHAQRATISLLRSMSADEIPASRAPIPPPPPGS